MKFLLPLLMVFSAAATADFRSEIPGATRTELEIRWLWKYLGETLLSCSVATGDCQNAELKPYVVRLIEYVPSADSAALSQWEGLLHLLPDE